MALLDINALPYDWFHRSSPDTLVAEASTLGFPVGRPPYERLYDDACDVGIRIQGKTRKVRFLFVEEITNAYENDLESWNFKPLEDAGPIKRVIIFND
jgi:hypothetical protein